MPCAESEGDSRNRAVSCGLDQNVPHLAHATYLLIIKYAPNADDIIGNCQAPSSLTYLVCDTILCNNVISSSHMRRQPHPKPQYTTDESSGLYTVCIRNIYIITTR